MFELLRHVSNSKTEQAFIKIAKGSEDEDDRIFDVNFQPLTYQNRECTLVSVRDISELRKFQKISENNKILTLLTSSVTHEMITPLRCIIQFTHNVLKQTPDLKQRKELQLILSTSQLLLSQVKLLLDRNMLERNIF